MVQLFGTLASLTIIAVYYFYLQQVRRGDSDPNPATWSIWCIVSVMNAASYFTVVRGNWFQWIISIVTTVFMVMLFLYTFFTGKFARLKWPEITALVLAFIIGIFWKTTGNAKLSNLFLQLILVISFVPTLRGLVKGTAKEKPLPWELAVLAYAFQIAAVLADFKGDWLALAYPVITGVFGNGSVAILAVIKKPRAS